MTLALDIGAARMRQCESIPLGDTARVAVALSVPAILQQLVVTAMEYIDAAMVGHIGAEATAAIGIVSSSTWLLHGILVGLFTSFAIQIAQYLGADRQEDARGVLRQSMIFNILLGCGMAALEAMAAGLPLITVRSHGTKTYAEKGESGFCLKGDLVTSCADAIEQLADNKLLRRQMGARNRAAAAAFSDADRMMLLRGYYQKALGD